VVFCLKLSTVELGLISEKISYDEIRYKVFSLQPYVMHVLESLVQGRTVKVSHSWVTSQGLTHGDTLSIAIDGLMALYGVPNVDNP